MKYLEASNISSNFVYKSLSNLAFLKSRDSLCMAPVAAAADNLRLKLTKHGMSEREKGREEEGCNWSECTNIIQPRRRRKSCIRRMTN